MGMKRARGSMKRARGMQRTGSTSDIISYLPRNLIEKILTHLPIQDAVRTSVLSRRWRYIWMNLPQLVFDDMFCSESIKERENILMVIYQVLLLHRGPILKFTLDLSELESCSEIDQLILFVSNNGVRDFTLHISEGEPLKLPSSLFSCLELTHLNLHCCMFKPPPGFNGFSSLLYLELCEVDITADIFSRLLSSCPLLEQLKFESSTCFDYLEIVAPNLRSLEFEGHFSSICFKNTPRLASVSIYVREDTKRFVFIEGETSNSIMFFESLPAIELLQLDYYYVKYLSAGATGIPTSLPTTLSYLKILNLYDISFRNVNEVSVVHCLIRSSPNLEKIGIEAFTDGTVTSPPILELLDVEDWSDVSLNQLREVTMKQVSGRRSELEFIKLLLAISPMLETILIEPDLGKVADKGLMILKEVTRYRRSSPQAEIIFRDQV